MIVEASFLKLPELLMGASFDFHGSVEATVRHLFATAVMMELIGRGTPRPQEHVTAEKAYPAPPPGTHAWADLLVNLQGAAGPRMVQYGTRERNWIEIKTCLGGVDKINGTRRIGGIVKDLLRLCLFPEELQGAIRQNARFLLLVTDQPFETYLPRLDQRKWLGDLLMPGSRSIDIDLGAEVASIRSEVFALPGATLTARFGINVHTFKPIHTEGKPVFWGVLARVGSFEIGTSTAIVSFDELRRWSESDNEQLIAVRGILRRAVEGAELSEVQDGCK
jgi:hypothetical protein